MSFAWAFGAGLALKGETADPMVGPQITARQTVLIPDLEIVGRQARQHVAADVAADNENISSQLALFGVFGSSSLRSGGVTSRPARA
jgi:hypothetical protein